MMAYRTKRITTYSNWTYSLETFPIVPDVQWYMHREDREVFGSVRSCAPCPAVMILKDDPHARISQQLQYYLRAINYNMTVDDVYLLLDKSLAFANGTGFRMSDDPRADYFHNKDLQYHLPNLDKVRTTARSVLAGTEQYSLLQAIQDFTRGIRLIFARSKSTLLAKSLWDSLVTTSANVLSVDVFDSNELPPLKTGHSYPQDISEVDPAAYLYMPETHPEKFLVANIVNRAGEVVQFPRGALYPWTGDQTIYSFVPHIANLAYGPILYSMNNLLKLPLGSPKPSPYRQD